MKEDAPTPELIPTKRKDIQRALDRWLREWLNDPIATTHQRQMLQGEINRRKSLQTPARVGIVIGFEGVSPEQLAKLVDLLDKAPPTAIVTSTIAVLRVRKALRPFDGLPWIMAEDFKDLVQDSTVVYAFARPGAQTGVGWDAMRYAKHRKVPVRFIMQNGEESPLSKGSTVKP